MKKILTLLCLLLFTVGAAFAQRTITGTVKDAKGEPLVGANVLAKGTAAGVAADIDGNFSIKVPKETKLLVVSYTGFSTQEVELGVANIMDVVLEEDTKSLSEFVVTALNISRDKKSLGYTVQELKSEKLTLARETNVANALAGKIAGVQVLGQSGAKFGTPSIRIRGVNGLTGGDPLYVVDGTPTSVDDVNMDDVDKISVLKGPAATALYGNRASSGVIVITTKMPKNGEVNVTVNHSTSIDQVSLLPKLQNEYGGGYSQDWETFSYNAANHPAEWKAFDGQKILDYSADESWGPKLDGSLHRSAFSWQPGPQFGQLTPFSPQPNNVRQFFNTPINNNTNIAFAKGGENYGIRISATHLDQTGVIPNSKQTKDYISATTYVNVTSKLKANVRLAYTNTNILNRPADQYGSSGNVLDGYNQTIGSLSQWFQRQLITDDLRNYKNTDGTYRSWNIGGPTDPRPKYWDSPFTEMYENNRHLNQNRLTGDVGVTYQIFSFLKANATVRKNFDDYVGDGRVAYGTLNAGGKGAYSTYFSSNTENNYEGSLAFDKTFEKIFSVKATLGGNIRQNRNRIFAQSTSGGLTTPGFYNIAASKDRPIVLDNQFNRNVNSVYGSVSFGYKNFAYLDVTGRNDWSSTLPDANKSFFYPSVTGSLILSEILPKNDVLSFLKVRGGYAKVGTDVGPYQTSQVYNTGIAYGSNPLQTIPSQLFNANLVAGLSTAVEGGMDFKFLNDRIAFEWSVYQTDNKNQIISLPIPSTSGFSTALINAGNIQSKGIEFHLFVNPVKTKDFNWEMDFNFDKNQSKVVALAPGLTNFQIDASWRGITVNAREGEQYGLIVGRKIPVDPVSGKYIVGADGFYKYDINQPLGSVLPKFKGGFMNTLNYKNFIFRFNIDFVYGGKFFSVTRMFNAYSGLAAETAGLNELGKPKRDPVASGGGILIDAVTADGKPNTTRVETQDYYENSLFALHDKWIFDQTFVKLREVALGYTVPAPMLDKLGKLKGLYIGVMVRNPLLLYSKIGGGIDPSESEKFWTEGGQLPPVRSWGGNVKFTF